MANSVKLRRLTRSERRVLAVKMKDRTLRVRVHRRYRVIAEVARGRSLVEIADRVGCHVSMAYEWIHRFNTSGFTTFEQAPNPKGRPPIITGPQVRELIDIALSSPAERGLPFLAWTIPKLAEYCRRRGLLPPITDEWVRRLLRRQGLRAHLAWVSSFAQSLSGSPTHGSSASIVGCSCSARGRPRSSRTRAG